MISVVEECCEMVGREGKLHGGNNTSKGSTVFTKKFELFGVVC